jgi:hypothetical protein
LKNILRYKTDQVFLTSFQVDGKGAKGFHEVIMDEIQDMKRSLAEKVTL